VIVGANILAIRWKRPSAAAASSVFSSCFPGLRPSRSAPSGGNGFLDSIYSVITWVLVAVHIYKPFSAPMWLGEPHLAIASVLLVHSWRLMPFSTVICLPAERDSQGTFPEAAAVDGRRLSGARSFQIMIP